jgi:uncharacterized integral membrane protein
VALIVFGLGVIVGMAVLTFAFANQESVTLRYLGSWQTPALPLFAVIMAAAAAGFVVASLFGLAAYLRQRKIMRQQRRTIANLHAELQSLRTLPLDVPSEPGGSRRGADGTLPSAGEFSR